MKAITICQPYASAIMVGIKRVENREWATPYRGPLLIHCGKSKKWMDSYDGRQEEEMRKAGFRFDEDGGLIITKPQFFGAILGTVEMLGCVTLDKYQAAFGDDPWAFGKFCWILGNPVWLEKPIPYRGQLGIFEVPDSVILSQK